MEANQQGRLVVVFGCRGGGEVLSHRAPKPVLSIFAAMLVVVAASGCRAGPAEESFDSGVSGVSVVVGSCPETPKIEACPDRPMPAHLTVTRVDSDEVVARAATSSDGNFRIPLAPGAYTVTPTNMSAAPMPSAHPISFDVREGEFTTVTVRFDSGVR